MGEHAKAIVGVLVALAGAIGVAIGPGDLGIGDLGGAAWVGIILAVLAAPASVWLIENSGAAPVAKAIAAAATGGLGALAVAMNEESAAGTTITQGEWLGVFIAAAAATGFVYQVANERRNVGG